MACHGSQKQFPSRTPCVLRLSAQKQGRIETPSCSWASQDTHICQPDQIQDNRDKGWPWGNETETLTQRHPESVLGETSSSPRTCPYSSRPAADTRPLPREAFPASLLLLRRSPQNCPWGPMAPPPNTPLVAHASHCAGCVCFSAGRLDTRSLVVASLFCASWCPTTQLETWHRESTQKKKVY